jgi:conjugal transfer pilus assembly protein TraU
MMKSIKNILVGALLVAASVTNALAVSQCTGQFFNPISDLDWNYMFPITVAGVQMNNGSNTNPPLMAAMPPVCLCPSVLTFGYPTEGYGSSWWEPTYLVETETRAGCLSSMGGVKVLSNYSGEDSEKSSGAGAQEGSANRVQVHWFTYPAFNAMDIMSDVTCKNPSGIGMTYMTEPDKLWQDDEWGIILSPEAVLFANPIAMAACSVDAVAASLGAPLDPLFWCAGNWGGLYPLTGNTSHTGSDFQENNLILAKFIARFHRMGMLFQTIGPDAICFSHPNPIVVKSQYRFNQTAPWPRKGRAVVFGDSGLTQTPVNSNGPTKEWTNTMIWQGKQCCNRIP